MKLRKVFTLCLTTVALILGGGRAVAGNITYSLGNAAYAYGAGGKNAETYDVALHIVDPTLVGAQIRGVRIAFPFTEKLGNAKAWLTKELPAIKSSKAGDPDITSKAFDVSTDYTEVLFAEPYTITTDGVYVGYSFDVEKSDENLYPVLVASTSTPEGFYIHSTKIFRTAWRSQMANDLAIEVLLSGDQFRENAATAANVREMNVKTGEAYQATFDIVNHGTQGVQSFDYVLSVDGQTLQGHTDLDAPIAAIYGKSQAVSIPMPPIAAKGAYTLDVVLTKVNGAENTDASGTATGLVNAYNTLPKHRAVVEEYTGTWCGYCPRGFVGLEEMNRLYPGDFIGISYHNGDPMDVFPTSAYPWNAAVLGSFPGYPSCALDRAFQTDAFCGDSEYGTFGIDKTWLSRCEVFAPASVEVATEWKDAGTLSATAYITFPVDRDDCPYEVGFVLISNGLTGTTGSWQQSNYYGGAAGWPASMDQFTQGESYVSGLVFNDVIVARSGIAGIQGSLSAPIVSDVAQTYDYVFDVAALGDVLVQDKTKLDVVVLLINKETGEIVNANKAKAGSATTDIGQVARAEDEVVTSVAYYDLQGRRLVQPREGICVKAETLASGRVRSTKVKF